MTEYGGEGMSMGMVSMEGANDTRTASPNVSFSLLCTLLLYFTSIHPDIFLHFLLQG